MSRIFSLTLIAVLAVSSLSLTMLTVKSTFAQNGVIPSVSILYPTNNTVFNVSIEGVYIQMLYQTNDTISWAGYSINGGANVTCTGNVTDYTEFLNDEYQFDFGHPTLTLYANDTAGNWATPQTVTYTVYFYADSTFPPTTPSPTPPPTAPIPEFPAFALLPLLLSVLSVAVMVRRRKTANLRCRSILFLPGHAGRDSLRGFSCVFNHERRLFRRINARAL